MPMNEDAVKGAVKTMLGFRDAEQPRLERIRLYVKDPEPGDAGRMQVNGLHVGPLAWLPNNTPDDVKRLAHMSRVNMMRFVVNGVVQVMYVDGYRAPKAAEEQPQWETWQLNRMAARQIGVHRSSLTYGASYVTVLPGDSAPVLRGHGPRKLTVVFEADNEDWPKWALEQRRSMNKSVRLFRLFDATDVYWVEVNDKDEISLLSNETHNMGVCPVVRFRPTIDDDDESSAAEGEVEPLIPLQDQINVTTFGLLVAQHYGAFRQRYILGWLADNEQQALKASARKLWTFEDPETKVGEFGQTDLKGYIESREATLRHLATVSQTPAHELLGQLVNLSAEALAAAESNHRRKVEERQTVMGQGWEQVFELAGQLTGVKRDPMAYIRWRDTEARSLATVADALGKMATMLGIPPQELWERIPGVSQQEVERWKAAAKEPDAIAQLNAILERQAAAGGGVV